MNSTAKKTNQGSSEKELKSASTVQEQEQDDWKSSSSSQYNGFAPISASAKKESEQSVVPVDSNKAVAPENEKADHLSSLQML